MTKEEMMYEVIRSNGFENKWTVWFFEICEKENITDDTLMSAFICATQMPKIEMAVEDEE